MKTVSKRLLFSVAAVCSLSIAGAREPGTEPAGSAADTQSPSSATTATSSGSTSQSQSQTQDGIVKHKGAVMFVKNGQPQRVDRELKLSEGITVQPDGDVTLKDGTKLTLQEGQMVTLDSKVTSIPQDMTQSLDKESSGGSASGQTLPGASSGSSLGSGSNSTLAPGSGER